MLKKPARFVLAALKDSTYGKKVRLALSLAAASLDGLFEHPELVRKGWIADSVNSRFPSQQNRDNQIIHMSETQIVADLLRRLLHRAENGRVTVSRP